MMAAVIPTITWEMEFSSGVWTDIGADVLHPARVKYGIKGNGVRDRVASTGTMKFDLNNSASNSGGLLGYYAPGHANARSGFEIGTACRVTITDGVDTKRFYGRIAPGGIVVDPGQKGSRRTHVTVEDWMAQAARFPILLPTLQTDKTIEEVVAAIVALMPIAPLSTSYGSGEDTFAYVFDTVESKTKAISEFQKLAISEMGYIYVKRDATYGEVLAVDGRYTRSDNASGATFDNTMISFTGKWGGAIVNRVRSTTYPREIDTAATTVLFALQKAINIGSGETKTILGKFRDPTGGSSRVSGKEMVTPVATTDYVMNTAEDGSGSDITADLVVSATYGTEGVKYELTNNNAASGWITKLQARGKGIYFYDPVKYEESDIDSINAYGELLLTIDQKYQDDPLIGEGFSQYWLSRLLDPKQGVNKMGYNANRNAAHMTAFLTLDIGSRYSCVEDVKGVDADFYINAVEFEISPGKIINAVYVPVVVDDQAFWKLETTGYSELEETTILGY